MSKEKLIVKYIELYIKTYGSYNDISLEETREKIKTILEHNIDKVIINSSFIGGQFEYKIVKSDTRKLSTLIHELRHAHTSKNDDPKTDGLNYEIAGYGDNSYPLLVNILDEAVTEKIASEMLGKSPNAYFSAIPYAFILGEIIGHDNLRIAQEEQDYDKIRELFGREKISKLETEVEMLSFTSHSNSGGSYEFLCEFSKYFMREIEELKTYEQAQIMADKIANIDRYLHTYNISKNSGYIDVMSNAKSQIKSQYPNINIPEMRKSRLFINMIKDNIRYFKEYQPKIARTSGMLKKTSQVIKIIGIPLATLGILGKTSFEAYSNRQREGKIGNEYLIGQRKNNVDSMDSDVTEQEEKNEKQHELEELKKKKTEIIEQKRNIAEEQIKQNELENLNLRNVLMEQQQIQLENEKEMANEQNCGIHK